MNHYPHHIGDYAKDTMGLSQGEHGAYRLLMDAAYATESGIPADEVYVIARAHCPAERKNVDRVLSKFFQLRETGWHQKRIDEEVAIYQAKAAQSRANGLLGGRPKANPEITQAVPGEEPKSNPKITLANNQEPITKKLLRRASRLPTDWSLTSGQIEWALGAQPTWDAEYALKVGEKFRDYWSAKAGRDASKLDWDATWRNWVRNEPASKSLRREDPFKGAV